MTGVLIVRTFGSYRYLREHPDEKQKDEEDWFEEEQIRELRQIFQGQSEVRALVQGLSRKLDEIVGRQETTISLVTSIQASGFAIGQQGAGQPPPAAQPVAGGAGAPIQRHEIDGILAASRELVQSTREMRYTRQILQLDKICITNEVLWTYLTGRF